MNSHGEGSTPAKRWGEFFEIDGRWIRPVDLARASDVTAALNAGTMGQLIKQKRCLPVSVKQGGDLPSGVGSDQMVMALEHPKVFFPSYAFEWSPEMLHEAATLVLDMASGLLEEGLGLQTTTPNDIQFMGCRATFTNWLVVEHRDPLDPTWLAFEQYVRMFLLPLLAAKKLNVSLDELFLSKPQGLTPGEAYALSGLFQRFSPQFISLVTLPAWLAKRGKKYDPDAYQKRLMVSAAQAKAILKALMRTLRQALQRVEVSERTPGFWRRLVSGKSRAAREAEQAKMRFLWEALNLVKPRAVLDIGCQHGKSSLLAAGLESKVVSVNSDVAAMGQLWRYSKQKGFDILPLVVKKMQPDYPEQVGASFCDRASGAFDMVLSWSQGHSLLTDQAKCFDAILNRLYDLTTRFLIVECVPSMWKHLALDTDPKKHMDALCQKRFRIHKKLSGNDNSHFLWLLEKKPHDSQKSDSFSLFSG